MSLYTYDNLTYAKGRLTKVTSGTLTNGVISNPLSVTEYQMFDEMGRVTQSRQLVDGTAYGNNPMTYKYNLGGSDDRSRNIRPAERSQECLGQ